MASQGYMTSNGLEKKSGGENIVGWWAVCICITKRKITVENPTCWAERVKTQYAVQYSANQRLEQVMQYNIQPIIMQNTLCSTIFSQSATTTHNVVHYSAIQRQGHIRQYNIQPFIKQNTLCSTIFSQSSSRTHCAEQYSTTHQAKHNVQYNQPISD